MRLQNIFLEKKFCFVIMSELARQRLCGFFGFAVLRRTEKSLFLDKVDSGNYGKMRCGKPVDTVDNFRN